jgi:hypothetical protein
MEDDLKKWKDPIWKIPNIFLFVFEAFPKGQFQMTDLEKKSYIQM